LQADIFTYLLIGLGEFMEKERRPYPYPDALRYGMNHLSLQLSQDFPKTINGLLQLFAKPVQDWWPWELPQGFASQAPLIEDDNLSYEAANYLDKLSEQDDVAMQVSLSQIETILDRRKFRELFELLRNQLLIDPAGAQSDYVILRRFIIEHPYAELGEISHVFSETKYINAAQVNELYRRTGEISDVLRYPNSDGIQVFWLCEHCGPLHIKNGQRQSGKPSVCGKHCPRNRGGWKEIQPSNQLRVLRKAIHLHIHLPGIPELDLFNWLEGRRQEYPHLLSQVLLWPRIDTYDLQVIFVDSAWAVDVKDHNEPAWLGRDLTTIYGEGNLQWNRGFYVYPSYRDSQQWNYGGAIRLETTARLHGIEIVNDETFKDQVMSKLKALKKGQR
jgi:REase associating with pPIWI_RE/pPIWI_RE three-gene island domain Y